MYSHKAITEGMSVRSKITIKESQKNRQFENPFTQKGYL